MSFPLFLALRYLKSARRDAFTTFLSVVAAGGIALGVAALILALAALSGFQAALRGEILARTPALEVILAPGAGAEPAAAAVRAVPGVGKVERIIRGRGWLISGAKVHAAEFTGFEGELPAFFPGASGGAEGVYVADALAMAWGLEPGASLDAVSPRPTLTPFGPQPRWRRLEVTGTFATGRTEQEERVAVPFEQARALFGEGDVRLVVTPVGGDLDAALALAGALAAVLPAGSEVRTWQDLNRPLFFALRLEKAVMFVAVALIVLVAALALVADLALVISNKRAEIGMLGAMGAPPPALRRAFLWLGGLLAGFGTLSGGVVGVAAAALFDRYRVFQLPSRAYFLDYVPFAVRGDDLLAIVVLTLVLSLACSLYAAQRVMALRPVEALYR